MGQLHAVERYLVLSLAFGPFLILGLVVFVVRRRDIAEDEAHPEPPDLDESSSDVRTVRPPTR